MSDISEATEKRWRIWARRISTPRLRNMVIRYPNSPSKKILEEVLFERGKGVAS